MEKAIAKNATNKSENASAKSGTCNVDCLKASFNETFKQMGVQEKQRQPILSKFADSIKAHEQAADKKQKEEEAKKKEGDSKTAKESDQDKKPANESPKKEEEAKKAADDKAKSASEGEKAKIEQEKKQSTA